MRKIFLLALFSVCLATAYGQADNKKWYLNGIGGRVEVGASSYQLTGLDIDHFFKVKFDAGLFFMSNWTKLGLIVQGGIFGKYVASYPNVDSRLRWYAGGGITCGGKPEYDINGETTSGTQIYAGPMGILGTGYTCGKIPLNVNIEWRPSWNVLYTRFKKNNTNNERLQVAVIAFTAHYAMRDKY